MLTVVVGMLARDVAAQPPVTSGRRASGQPPVVPKEAPVVAVPDWKSAPSLHHARAAHAVAATAEAVFVFAGTGDGGPVLEVERFDGAIWTDEGKLPGEGLNAPAAVAIGDKVYLIGGFGTTTNVPTSEVGVYDTKLKQWGSVAELPAARGGHAAAVLNGLIHVVGGGNSRSTIADHSVFDPSSNKWVERAPLPHAEGSPAAVVAGGKLYAIGGRSGRKDFGDVMVYDPEKDSWTAGPPIEPRATCGAIEVGGAIYLIGGESQAQRRVMGEVLCLSAGADAWRSMAPMPTERSFARVVMLKGVVYVVGGCSAPQTSHAPRGLKVVERFDPEGR